MTHVFRCDTVPEMYGSKYAGMSPDWSKGRQTPQDAAKQKRAQGTSDFLRLLGTLAPIAGGVAGAGIGALAGGPVGAGIGMGIGSGVGQLAGGGLNYGAQQQTQPYDEEEMRRAAKLRAYQSYFASNGGGSF